MSRFYRDCAKNFVSCNPLNVRIMKNLLLLFLSLLCFSTYSSGQTKISKSTYKKVLKLEDSISVNNGNLKIINIFKVQVKTIYENQDKNINEFKNAIIQKTYVPFNEFWTGYVGDSNTYFEEIITPLLRDSVNLIEKKSVLFDNGKIDTYFKKLATQFQERTGYFPRGKWYLAFGSGVTDMGGFGGGVMVLDLTHYKTSIDYVKFILPHELTHQIFDFTNQEDTSAKGLYRIINEGLAVYINEMLVGSKYKLHEYLQYSEQELSYCMNNESIIFTKLKPFLFTNNSEHAIALADRGQKIFKECPGAIGYFLGYRICQAYVMNNGPDSWKDLFTKPVKEILQQSGYN